jgi:hypothetical protein
MPESLPGFPALTAANSVLVGLKYEITDNPVATTI